MGIQLERALSSTLFCYALVLARGLEIPDPEHIAYIRQKVNSTVNSTVSLHCGSSMPTFFIWVFSKTGSDGNEAIAYNYGPGPKTMPVASTLGDPFLATNTSTLLIKNVQSEAEGVYTCQALYDAEKGPKVTFYYTELCLNGQDTTNGSKRLPPARA